MAGLSDLSTDHSLIIISLSVLFLLMISPSLCLNLTCTSQKFTNKLVYANCSDLPKLGAYLHYSYDAANSSLSIAYVATPAANGSWVAWAINPTATGMIGSQALMALKLSDGSIVAKTFNISSYGPIVESKLSFEVWNLAAMETNGTMMIFASVKVPEKATSVNQVWQIGGAVEGMQPKIHSLQPNNKESMGELVLVESGNNATVKSPAPAPSGSSTIHRTNNVGLFSGFVLLLVALVAF